MPDVEILSESESIIPALETHTASGFAAVLKYSEIRSNTASMIPAPPLGVSITSVLKKFMFSSMIPDFIAVPPISMQIIFFPLLFSIIFILFLPLL